jgi:hypothetical protein
LTGAARCAGLLENLASGREKPPAFSHGGYARENPTTRPDVLKRFLKV